MKVFLSYRRADSQATAGRLAQFLDGIPGVDEVFLGVSERYPSDYLVEQFAIYWGMAQLEGGRPLVLRMVNGKSDVREVL